MLYDRKNKREIESGRVDRYDMDMMRGGEMTWQQKEQVNQV